jgi:hypothetical protein
MRKALLLLIVLLVLTGVPLVWALAGEGAPAWRKALALAHIWGGFFFLVVFPLYAWDHIRTNRAWLRVWAWVTVSGLTQLVTGSLLLLSGLVLLIYQSQAWDALRTLHHWLTYVLFAALLTHFVARKT